MLKNPAATPLRGKSTQCPTLQAKTNLIVYFTFCLEHQHPPFTRKKALNNISSLPTHSQCLSKRTEVNRVLSGQRIYIGLILVLYQFRL